MLKNRLHYSWCKVKVNFEGSPLCYETSPYVYTRYIRSHNANITVMCTLWIVCTYENFVYICVLDLLHMVIQEAQTLIYNIQACCPFF